MSRHGVLLILGLLHLAAVAGIASLGDPRLRMGPFLALWAAAHAVYLAAAWLVIRREPGTADGESAPRASAPRRLTSLGIVIGVAVAARALLLPVDPTLSEDVYRYLWDGRLVAHGVNPYAHAPADSALAPFHDDLLDRLNHFDVPTIYPPAAQLVFGAIATLEPRPWAVKLATGALEIALWIALLNLLRRRGLAEERLLIFAWSPLVLIESYGSGHLDLWTAAFLVVALAMLEVKRSRSSGMAYALAVMTKYTPLLLVPYLLRRRTFALLGVAAAVCLLLLLPFRSAGASLWTGLSTYLATWEFNGSLYKLLRAVGLADPAARLVLTGALAAAALWISVRARTAPGAMLALFTAYLLVSPTVFPWYLVTLAALLPLYPSPALLAFTGLVALSYWPLPLYHATGRWTLPDAIVWCEYGGFAAVALATAWIRRRQGGYARRAAWASDVRPT